MQAVAICGVIGNKLRARRCKRLAICGTIGTNCAQGDAKRLAICGVIGNKLRARRCKRLAICGFSSAIKLRVDHAARSVFSQLAYDSRPSRGWRQSPYLSCRFLPTVFLPRAIKFHSPINPRAARNPSANSVLAEGLAAYRI